MTAVLVYEKVAWLEKSSVFFSSFPVVLSPVIVGVLFSTIFLPGGAVDKLLSVFGLGRVLVASVSLDGARGGDFGPCVDIIRIRHGGHPVGDVYCGHGAL